MKRLALIVTGDRHAMDDVETFLRWKKVVWHRLWELDLEYVKNVVVIHGACGQDEQGGKMMGIDAIADGVARGFHYSVVPVPARWKQFGKPAGPRRNTGMLKMQQFLAEHGYERLVLAFHDNLEESKGTKDCVKQASAMGVPYEVIGSQGRGTSLKLTARDMGDLLNALDNPPPPNEAMLRSVRRSGGSTGGSA